MLLLLCREKRRKGIYLPIIIVVAAGSLVSHRGDMYGSCCGSVRTLETLLLIV
jgi:hypothetical protein